MSDSQTSRPQHLDMAGKPILLGSLIVYATSSNSSGRMKCGIVRDLQWRSIQRWVGGASRSNGGDGHYEDHEQPKVNVITAENNVDWLGNRDAGDGAWSFDRKWHVQKRGRTVMLDRLDELLVVSEDSLPQHVVLMLRAVLLKSVA